MPDEFKKKMDEMSGREKESRPKLKQIADIVIAVPKELYPDSMEIDFGGPGKRGKLYFNADNLDEAKTRLQNAFKLHDEKERLMKKIIDTQ